MILTPLPPGSGSSSTVTRKSKPGWSTCQRGRGKKTPWYLTVLIEKHAKSRLTPSDLWKEIEKEGSQSGHELFRDQYLRHILKDKVFRRALYKPGQKESTIIHLIQLLTFKEKHRLSLPYVGNIIGGEEHARQLANLLHEKNTLTVSPSKEERKLTHLGT